MYTLPPELMDLIRDRDWEALHTACVSALEGMEAERALIFSAQIIEAIDLAGGGLGTDPEACRTAGWILMQAGAEDHAAQYLQVAEALERAAKGKSPLPGGKPSTTH